MDFGIVTGWQVCTYHSGHESFTPLPKFPAYRESNFASIDGALLDFVHLLDGSRMLDGAPPLHFGDRVKAEVKIASIIHRC